MSSRVLTVDLADASRADMARVGGKAANLGELIDQDFLVPGGFIVTTDAYALFAEENNLQTTIDSELAIIDFENPGSIDEHAAKIRKTVESAHIPEALTTEIEKHYSRMGSTPVAVRSSSTAEDLASASSLVSLRLT